MISEGYMLCESCIDEQIISDDPEEHQWWHSMLVLRHDIIIGWDDAASDSSSEDESEPSNKKKNHGADSAAIISAIGERISEVEAKLDTTNSMLQEALSTILEDKVKAVGEDDNDNETPTQTQALDMRMSQLEDKVDGMVMELRSFMGSFSERFSDY
jgi:tetrahydromethanopterin S-methyltransferase subunit G